MGKNMNKFMKEDELKKDIQVALNNKEAEEIKLKKVVEKFD